MRSTLKLTGRCHFCDAPTPKRFCDPTHNAMYHIYKRRGKTYGEKAERKTQDDGFTPKGGTEADRINAIAATAEANGTLGWLTIKPQMVTPGNDIFYRRTSGILKAHRL